MLEIEDNIHAILAESALKEKAFSIFDFNNDFNPSAKPKIQNEADTLKSAMCDAIDEIDAIEAGEIENPESCQEKSCQTFSIPSDLKKQFEEICKNNVTTPSAFLRNVCARLVESYFGKKEDQ